MPHAHSKYVKTNFEQKAKDYDAFMLKCVPDYMEMIECMVAFLPCRDDDYLKICDLGSGTGNVTKLLVSKFPKADIRCVDISLSMTELAKAKLKNDKITFDLADFYEYEFTDRYDVITASLALHHLISDDDKKMFYTKIFAALKNGGVFYNADVVIGASPQIEDKFMEQWKNWLRQYHSEKDLMEKVVNRYYQEDRPTTIINHINWLGEIGFKNVDIIWKKMKGIVYGGYKLDYRCTSPA